MARFSCLINGMGRSGSWWRVKAFFFRSFSLTYSVPGVKQDH
jgi:hypothetical protein